MRLVVNLPETDHGDLPDDLQVWKVENAESIF